MKIDVKYSEKYLNKEEENCIAEAKKVKEILQKKIDNIKLVIEQNIEKNKELIEKSDLEIIV